MKVVKIELKGEHETRFTSLKSYFGVSHDTELIRVILALAHDLVFGKGMLLKKIEKLKEQGEVTA